MITIDTACVELSRSGNAEFSSLPQPIRYIAGINSGVSVRNAGFAAVPVDMLHPPFVFIQMAMMFIQAYPVVIIMRNTNLYLERQLGVYKEDMTHTDLLRKDTHPSWTRLLARHFKCELGYVFLRAQLRQLVARDGALVFCATLLICILELYFRKDPERPVDMLECVKITFEVVSAYGNVGLSYGLVGTVAR